MDYDEFFRQAEELTPNFDSLSDDVKPYKPLSNDALFHIPLLAISILSLCKIKGKFTIPEVGQVIGECFERTLPGFKGSAQLLEWSSNLRVRTITALCFLEESRLIEVSETSDKNVVATKQGRKLVDRVVQENSELSYVISKLQRNYNLLKKENNIELGF